MCIQSTQTSQTLSPRTARFRNRLWAKELIPMCVIRIENASCDPSMLELARRCKQVLVADISPELEVAFVGLSPEGAQQLAEFRAKHDLITVGDWAFALNSLFAPGSDHCPNCGLNTFTEPMVFCSCCGENPGQVFERAGGVFPTDSP